MRIRMPRLTSRKKLAIILVFFVISICFMFNHLNMSRQIIVSEKESTLNSTNSLNHHQLSTASAHSDNNRPDSTNEKKSKAVPDSTNEKKSKAVPNLIDKEKSEAVREAMLHSWNAYKRFAWGKDELHPVQQIGSTWFNCSLTMIESLDTLWLMRLNEQFDEVERYLRQNLSFDYDADHSSFFETTIRVLGGLLSAHALTANDSTSFFLDKAQDVGSRLLHAFDNQPFFPTSDVNLAKRQGHQASWTTLVSLAEVGSVQLEFNLLAYLTNDRSFVAPVAKVYRHLHGLSKRAGVGGLLPIMLNSRTGEASASKISLGARGDSYYEYLVKVWVQLGKRVTYLADEYKRAVESIRTRLLRQSKPSKFWFVGQMLDDDGDQVNTEMDHLLCFLPGTLIYGVMHGMPLHHVELAKQLMRTCYALYNQTLTGLSPESVWFNSGIDFDIRSNSRQNILRPETMESLFYLYQYTHDPVYREWGWRIFSAFNQHSRLPSGGFTGLMNVLQLGSTRIDKMETFWLAETLKYAYLLFNTSAANSIALDRWVFNTEAHPFPIHRSSSLVEQAYRMP